MWSELKRLYNSFKWHLILLLTIEVILIILFTIKSKETFYDISIIRIITFFMLVIPILLSFFTINFKNSIPDFEMSLPGKYSAMVLKRFFLGTMFVISFFTIFNLTIFRNEFYFKFFVPGLIIYFFIYVTLLYIQIYRKQFFIFIICIILFLFLISLASQITFEISRDVIVFKFLRAAIIYNSIFYLFSLLTVFLNNINNLGFKKRVLLISLFGIILTFFFYIIYLSHPYFGQFKDFRIIGEKIYITKKSFKGNYISRKNYNIKTKKIIKRSIAQYDDRNYIIYENENGRIEYVYKMIKFGRRTTYDDYYLISTPEYCLKIKPWKNCINPWISGHNLYDIENVKNYYWNTCKFLYVSNKNILYKINLKTFEKEQIMNDVTCTIISHYNFSIFQKNGEYFIVNEKVGVRKIQTKSEKDFNISTYYISDNHVYMIISHEAEYYLKYEGGKILLDLKYRYLAYSKIIQFGEYLIISLESGEYILKGGKLEVWPHGKINGCTNIGDYFVFKYDEHDICKYDPLSPSEFTIILKNPEHQIIAEQKFKIPVEYKVVINYIDGDYYLFMVKSKSLRNKYFPFYKQYWSKGILQIYKLSDGKWELYDEIR